MKNKNEFGIVIHYTIVVPPCAITSLYEGSYGKYNKNYKPEYRNDTSQNTVCKNKFT